VEQRSSLFDIQKPTLTLYSCQFKQLLKDFCCGVEEEEEEEEEEEYIYLAQSV